MPRLLYLLPLYVLLTASSPQWEGFWAHPERPLWFSLQTSATEPAHYCLTYGQTVVKGGLTRDADDELHIQVPSRHGNTTSSTSLIFTQEDAGVLVTHFSMGPAHPKESWRAIEAPSQPKTARFAFRMEASPLEATDDDRCMEFYSDLQLSVDEPWLCTERAKGISCHHAIRLHGSYRSFSSLPLHFPGGAEGEQGTGSRDLKRECVSGGGCVRFVPEGPCVAELEYAFRPAGAISVDPGAATEGIWKVTGKIYEDEEFSYSCTATFGASLTLTHAMHTREPALHTKEACAAAPMGISEYD